MTSALPPIPAPQGPEPAARQWQPPGYQQQPRASYGDWHPPVLPPLAVPPGVPRTPWMTRREVRAAIAVVLALAAVGAMLGVLWQWWAPPRPLGLVVAPHAIQVDESESFIAGDGRFAIIVGAVGLIAGIGAWFIRRARGPLTAVALAVGGLAGAWLTELVGAALGGGHANGPVNTLIPHLSLAVHAHALRLVEPMIAVLAYAICVAFASRDDLGV